MPKKPSTIASRIRTAREAKQLSGSALASAADIGPSTLSEIESGKHEPGLRVGVTLAVLLGITPQFLAFGEKFNVAELPPKEQS